MMTNMTMTSLTTNNSTVESIAAALSLRYQWESLVADYKLDSYHGTIDNLKWFILHGKKGNRFRKNFEEAQTIAKNIIEYYNENTNISGLHR